MKVEVIFKSTKKFPLYRKYTGQFFAQEAFLELDCDASTIRGGYKGNIGNAVPSRVFHRQVLRFQVSNRISRKDLKIMLSKVSVMAERVIDGYSKEWNGKNFVGYFTDDAYAAMDEIISLADNYTAEY